MRGENGRERVLFEIDLPVPAVPSPVPPIREAVPTRSQPVPPSVQTGSLFPLYRGNGERDRVPAPRISNRIQVRMHPCGHPVIVAYDAPLAAITAWLDPYAITPQGEVWALQRHRPTYQLWGQEIVLRDRWNIPGKPPGPDRTVLAWHDCNQPIPAQHRLPTPATTATTAPASKEPPF